MAATPVSTITDAAGDLEANVLPIAAVGLGIGATVLALTKGWRLLKRFF